MHISEMSKDKFTTHKVEKCVKLMLHINELHENDGKIPFSSIIKKILI